MAAYTKLDRYHAQLFADQHLKKLKYDRMVQLYPGVFNANYVVETVRPATHEDYYLPARLDPSKAVVYDYAFTEKGCYLVGCFPLKKHAAPCEPSDDPHYVVLGKNAIVACQRACHDLYEDAMVLDTHYQNGRCRLFNYFLKEYALQPQGRSPDLTLQVTSDENLLLTDDYCQQHGLVLQDGDCTETAAQTVGEFFVGSTVYRSLNVLSTGPATQRPLPKIPAYLRKRLRRAVSPTTLHWGRFEIDPEFAQAVAEELAIDATLEITAGKVADVLSKTLPRHLQSAPVAAVLVKYHLPAKTLGQVLLRSGQLVSKLSTGLFVVGMGTLILDWFDPLSFHKVLTRADLDRLVTELRGRFWVTHPTRDLTPDQLFPILEGAKRETPDVVQFVQECVDEYLAALDVNSYGQRLRDQEEHLAVRLARLRKLPVREMVHWLVTSLFLALSFTAWLPYVLVAYLCYAVFYAHTSIHSPFSSSPL